jgi:outer membrane protein assembly factor BamB
LHADVLADEAAATWPQWRGPHRDGRVAPSRPWPDRLSDDVLRASWRRPLGPSYSGPIVSDDVVFTTETRERRFEAASAFDRRTGALIWEAVWEGAMSVPFFAKANGDWIRATPAYDGESLFVAGMRDVLVRIDAKTGRIVWSFDFVEKLGSPPPDFGFVSSPLVVGPHVFVQAGGAFCKVDKESGSLVWRTLEDGGGMWGSAFSSPILVEAAGRRQILVQTRERLVGVDPETGESLWSQTIPAYRGMNILTPTVAGDDVFTSAYRGRSLLFRLTNQGGALSASQAWSNKAAGYMSTPVVVDGCIYLHLQNQRFTCIDAATGESRWTTRPFGKYWSLVANGDRILALDERGDLLLIRANPERFELLDSRTVADEPTWAHLAVCGDEVFVRELHALTAYQWSEPPADGLQP